MGQGEHAWVQCKLGRVHGGPVQVRKGVWGCASTAAQEREGTQVCSTGQES